MKVYVKAKDGKPLMPTHPAKARVLVKQGKAKVVKRIPFTIQLTYESKTYTQPVTVGIDDGGVNVGIGAVADGKCLYQEEVSLRGDIKKKLDARRIYRRNRRNRKTRYRKARFANRKTNIPKCKVCGGNAPKSKVICRKCLEKVDGKHQAYAGIEKTLFRIPPSIKAKKDAIIRCIDNIPLPTEKIVLEDAFFDIQAMENPGISGEQYQLGPIFYHKNFKKACLTRDGHKCRVCKAKENLQVHHIKAKKDGGTDKLSNLMSLCETCHEKHHKQGLKLPRQKNVSFASAAHVQQGKNYLYRELSARYPVERTFGFVTSSLRGQNGVEKSHVNDAVVMAGGFPVPEFIKTLHLASRKRSLHEAKPRKGRKTPNREAKRNEKNTRFKKGFYRHDTVMAFGRIGYLASFTGASACRILDLNGKYIKKPGKSYKNVNLSETRRLHKNQGMVSFWAKA